ncbi:MAG: hypothetical protein ACLQNE_37180 [Thermoguttaceae bacterium]
MPVSLLVCEGEANSADVRVLAKLLAGCCAVQPLGGKYGMGDRIKARREAIGQKTVYGLLDGDFSVDFQVPNAQPKQWTGSDGTHLGWRWERKEIENYLIDPTVVERALNNAPPFLGEYAAALEAARNTIANYQAARIALTVCRPRFSPLPNCFGSERERMRHPFPDLMDEASCVTGMGELVERYQASQLVSRGSVEAQYRLRLSECLPKGTRFESYLHSFAGKDLLLAMKPALRRLGFASVSAFLEKILVAIDQTTEDLADWHGEWRSLRDLLLAA